MIKIEQLMAVTTKSVEELNKLLFQVSMQPTPLTYGYLLEFLKDPNVFLLTVKEGGMIVGMGTLIVFHTINGKRGNLEHIVIDEAYRGKGLGEKLSLRLIEIAREQKVKQLELTSNPSRGAANKLYQKLGFEKRETNVYRLKL